MDENWKLARKLRAIDQQQFFTLVRMYLSFELDLNCDDSEINGDKKARQIKWNLPFAKKIKGVTRALNNCEEPCVTTTLIKQISTLIEFLNKPENIAQEGIFRKTGNLKRQQELKARLSSEGDVDLENGIYSVHDCASILKTYLSELPEPLLTESLYAAYCQVESIKCADRANKALQLLVLLLPEENCSLLENVLKLLHEVAKNSACNKMCATNLATIFTPHLLWPRKLSAEALQANPSLSKIIVSMIEEPEKLFRVPDELARDIRENVEKRERLRRSPMLNESLCDGTTANTVFTFVDRERTAQENGLNPTELELAKLYAHIHALPDSAQKRKLVKNFNKTNGQGTPAVREERGRHRRSRSVKESLKKHLSAFGKNGPSSPSSNDNSSPDIMIKTPLLPSSLIKLKQETSKIKSTPCRGLKIPKENRDPVRRRSSNLSEKKASLTKLTQKRPSPTTADPSVEEIPPKRRSPNSEAMKTRKFTSPEAKSLILPTRRPSRTHHVVSDEARERNRATDSGTGFVSPSSGVKSPPGMNKVTSLRKLGGSQPVRTSPRLLPPTPVTMSNVGIHDHGLPCPSNYLTPQRRRVVTTSTPAPRPGGFVTPHVERNTSMSPITRSAQRMPRAMQETMMTPRSRKPVVSLSGSDLCHLNSIDRWTPEKRLILEESESSDKDSLSSTFRDYLISRSVLTASPVDLSFSSRTDDFQSLSSNKGSSLDDGLCPTKEDMSESLLFCLDGNDPSTTPPRKATSSCTRPLHVTETAI